MFEKRNKRSIGVEVINLKSSGYLFLLEEGGEDVGAFHGHGGVDALDFEEHLHTASLVGELALVGEDVHQEEAGALLGVGGQVGVLGVVEAIALVLHHKGKTALGTRVFDGNGFVGIALVAVNYRIFNSLKHCNGDGAEIIIAVEIGAYRFQISLNLRYIGLNRLNFNSFHIRHFL